VIFAFVGNGIFTGVYYSLQRLLKTGCLVMYSPIFIFGDGNLSYQQLSHCLWAHFSSKEYAELIWPIDLAIAVVWIIFGINMFGTFSKEENSIFM
jgi:cytochrome c oxidase cbb3-type subunit I/II